MGSAARFRRWWAFALILPNVPIVLYAMLSYEEGGLYQLAITLLRWSVFTLLYWLPVGWLLLYPSRTPVGILRTYLISIPLFFLCLTLSLTVRGNVNPSAPIFPVASCRPATCVLTIVVITSIVEACPNPVKSDR